VADLAAKAFSPAAVCNKPSIHHCRDSESKKAEATNDNPVQRLFRNNGNEHLADKLI
jgi:hypothetical protein